MQKIVILLSDIGVSKYKLGEFISDKFGLKHFILGNEIRELIIKHPESELTKEIRIFLDGGEVIPTALLDKIVRMKIHDFGQQNILLNGFPRNIEQLKNLESTAKEQGISIEPIWYIKSNLREQNDTDILNELHLKERESINLMLDRAGHLVWKVFEVTAVELVDPQLIYDKINASA